MWWQRLWVGVGMLTIGACGSTDVNKPDNTSGQGGAAGSGGANVGGNGGGGASSGSGGWTGGTQAGSGGSASGSAGVPAGGTAGSGGAAGTAGQAGSAGSGGSNGCPLPPLPGETCGPSGYECHPDADDLATCYAFMCATCDGFEGPLEQQGCGCVCDQPQAVVVCAPLP